MAAREFGLGPANPKAVDARKCPGLALRLADYGGNPLENAPRFSLSVVKGRVNGGVISRVPRGSDRAIGSRDETAGPPGARRAKLITKFIEAARGMTSVVGAISAGYSRFGDDSVAASAARRIGAAGAGVFVDPLQRIAIGPIAGRRPERRDGREAIQRRRAQIARRTPGSLA